MSAGAAVACFAYIQMPHAKIRVEGLGVDTAISAYVHKTVLDVHNDAAEDDHSLSQVRADVVKALKAKGYYGARTVSVTEGDDILMTVETGAAYTISALRIEGEWDVPITGIAVGDVLDAAVVLAAQRDLAQRIMRDRCVYNLDVSHRVLLNHDTGSAALRFIVKGARDVVFGDTTFEGGASLDRDYLERFVQYEAGACWDSRKVEATKAALIGTGLIREVDVTLSDKPPKDGRVPLHFVVHESAPRTVRLGAQYSTSEGAGLSAGWEHRNIGGAGESLSFNTKLSALRQSLGVTYDVPYFYADTQSLTLSSEIRRQDTEAYDETTLDAGVHLKRTLSEHWRGSVGGSLSLTRITDEDGVAETYGLVSVPLSFSYDSRDSVLDPHKGHSLVFKAEPFFDVLGQADPFYKARMTGTTYFDLGRSRFDPVLALRGSLGSIIGAARENIPPSKRFYAGGGGSIRGFGFQEAGLLDDEGDPLGGRSIAELSAELRLKFTDTIGGVAFVDGGGAYDESYPDVLGNPYIGAGVGVRYYTDFGPVRVDVGVPLRGNDGADEGFQLYISIGQAF